MEENELDDCKQPKAYKKLFYALCYFHANVIERKKFGAIGWNIRYNFTLEDLGVSTRQLKNFLNDFDDIPYEVIRFITADINYGGRVTDYIDGILSKCIINKYVVPEALSDDYYYSETKNYRSPPEGNKASYLKFIDALPRHSAPEAFGLHENAEITTN